MVQELKSFDPEIYAFSFCITLPLQIFGLSFHAINSMKMLWRFILFKFKFMENLKSSKQLCIQGLEQLKVTGKPIVKGTAGSGQEAKV